MERDLKLLVDSIDMHVHSNPALFERSVDDADFAARAEEYGMRGFVLKDHDSATAGRAYHVNRAYRDVHAIGGVVLNRSVGGINPYVVESALHYGARVVWFPSNHSRNHQEYFDTPDYPQMSRKRPQMAGEGLSVFDYGDVLRPEVGMICELIAEEDACLATGHLDLKEVRALQAEAKKRGVTKFLATHVNWALTRQEVEVQRELIAEGAYLEYVSVSCVSAIFWEQKPDELAQWIEELGGDRLILGSDLGQPSSPTHQEGMRMLLRAMLELGVSYDELEKMTKANPAHLLGLSA